MPLPPQLSGSKWNDARIYFRHNPDKFEYRSFKEQLGKTYGVMVYQEDVIKRLHYG
jgi:DNA polymerase III alpha subunit